MHHRAARWEDAADVGGPQAEPGGRGAKDRAAGREGHPLGALAGAGGVGRVQVSGFIS